MHHQRRLGRSPLERHPQVTRHRPDERRGFFEHLVQIYWPRLTRPRPAERQESLHVRFDQLQLPGSNVQRLVGFAMLCSERAIALVQIERNPTAGGSVADLVRDAAAESTERLQALVLA